jgi:hypothetical protein
MIPRNLSDDTFNMFIKDLTAELHWQGTDHNLSNRDLHLIRDAIELWHRDVLETQSPENKRC